MSIVLIGGMEGLGAQYIREAENLGMKLKVCSQFDPEMFSSIKNADSLVIFTNKVSHKACNIAVSLAKSNGIPVFMHHACGVCSLRQCLKCLVVIGQNEQMQTA